MRVFLPELLWKEKVPSFKMMRSRSARRRRYWRILTEQWNSMSSSLPSDLRCLWSILFKSTLEFGNVYLDSETERDLGKVCFSTIGKLSTASEKLWTAFVFFFIGCLLAKFTSLWGKYANSCFFWSVRTLCLASMGDSVLNKVSKFTPAKNGCCLISSMLVAPSLFPG